jgi:predicted RNase H-like HicB family nuclease
MNTEGKMMEYVILTFVVEREGEYHVSKCLELGTASFGSSIDEALDNLMDATEVYLNTLEDLGECRRVLKEKGVGIYSYEPAELEVRRAKFPADSTIRPTVVKLQAACA